MTNEERAKLIEAIKREIDDGYLSRKDYPPYELGPWDDRARYHAYVFRVMDEFAQGQHDGAVTP